MDDEVYCPRVVMEIRPRDFFMMTSSLLIRTHRGTSNGWCENGVCIVGAGACYLCAYFFSE